MQLIFRIHSKSNKSGEHPVYLRVNLNSKKADLRTKLSIIPKYWNKEKGRAKNTKAFTSSMLFNNRLNEIEKVANSEFVIYLDKYAIEPEIKQFKKLVESKLFGTDTNKKLNFIEYYDNYNRIST